MKLVLALALIVSSIIIINPALADLKPYSIDGDLSDWGITMADLSNGLNNNADSWKPDCQTCGDVDWIVEDNLDPRYLSPSPEYPYRCTWNADTHRWDYCVAGVHVTGTGQNYQIYHEPLLKDTRTSPPREYVPQPSGGEGWDIEALYFDDDEYFVYFGIVTSNTDDLGDLYLEVNGAGYGVILKDHDGLQRGEIYKNPSWLTSNWAAKENGDPIKTRVDPNNLGTKVSGAAIIVVKGPSDGVPSDNNYPNYIIEIKIDKRLIGSPPIDLQGNIGYALTCGNDYIEKEVTYNYETIPEFGAIIIPMGIILGFFYYHRNKNKRE